MRYLDNISLELVLIALGLIGFLGLTTYIIISDIIRKRKCSRCKSIIHTRLIARDDLGKFGEYFGDKDRQTFLVTYKCKKCGNIWSQHDIETYNSS